jgi:hypothetical protein
MFRALQALFLCVVLTLGPCSTSAFLQAALSSRRQNAFRLEVETPFSREQIFCKHTLLMT